MANNIRKVGLKIEVDGEREYKQSIEELNRDNRVLASELQKVNEQYKGQENSIEALSAKASIFEDQLAAQSRKVQETRNMLSSWQAKLEEVRKTFGATSDEYKEAQKQVSEYEIKLNNAERDQIKLERAVKDANQALKDQGDAAESAGGELVGLGDQIDELTSAFGIHVPEAAKGALNEMASFSSGTVAVMAEAAGGIAAVYEVGKQLYDLTAEAAAAADALLTRSAQTGLSTDQLQQLNYAQNFLDFEGIDQSLSKLTQSMGAATTETSKQAAAFRELGVEIYNEDGKLRNNYDVFLDVIDALGTMDDKTRADILANQLFARSYTDLNPLIDAGSRALKTYTDRAAKLGYVIDEQLLKSLGRFDDARQEFNTAAETAKTEVAGFFAPIFQSLTDLGTGAVNLGRRLAKSDVFKFVRDLNPLWAAVDIWHDVADAVYEYEDAQEAAASAAPTTAEAIQGATTTMYEAVTALREKYDEALNAAKASLDGQFGLWQEAPDLIGVQADAIAERVAKAWETAYNESLRSVEGVYGTFDEFVGFSVSTADDMNRALESQLTYWTWYQNALDEVLNSGIEGVGEFVKSLSDGSNQSAANLAGFINASQEQREEMIANWQALQEKQAEVAESFADLKTTGQTETENLATAASGSINEMVLAQQTQEQYWQTYEQNFNALLERNIAGVDKLAANFKDGGEKSASYLAALATASDEDIVKLIESMDKTEEAKGNLAQRFADLTVDVDGELEKIKSDFADTVTNLNETAGNVDFSAFETSVNDAFGFLEERADTAVANVRIQLAALSAEIDAVEARQRNHSFGVQHGYNAGGTDNWRGGLTWVGESGPELVSLPRGTAIHSAQESRQLAAAPQDNRRVEALLERNVALLERISGEFSGLRVKGRMAM